MIIRPYNVIIDNYRYRLMIFVTSPLTFTK